MGEIETMDFEAIVRLVARLRSAGGCSWDQQQTRESLKPYILEETYELLDAVDHGSPEAIKKELGDLLFNIAFYVRLAEEDHEFNAHSVFTELKDRMVARHKHVFVTGETGELKTLLKEWEYTKGKEEGKQDAREDDSLLRRTSLLPALLQAYEVQARAQVLGWKTKLDLQEWERKCTQAIESLTSSRKDTDRNIKMGEILFDLVDIYRQHGVNAEVALRAATRRFVREVSP